MAVFRVRGLDDSSASNTVVFQGCVRQADASMDVAVLSFENRDFTSNASVNLVELAAADAGAQHGPHRGELVVRTSRQERVRICQNGGVRMRSPRLDLQQSEGAVDVWSMQPGSNLQVQHNFANVLTLAGDGAAVVAGALDVRDGVREQGVALSSKYQLVSQGAGGHLARVRVLLQGEVAYRPTSGTRTVLVHIVGGGGGGGGVAANIEGAGGGGGAGAVAIVFASVSDSSSYAIVVGAEGLGGSAVGGAGQAGGASSLRIGAVTHVGGGGAGGAGSTQNATSSLGGPGGASSAGLLTLFGENGSSSIVSTTREINRSGCGGNGWYGRGGAAVLTSGHGVPAQGYGAGGSGGTNDVTGSTGRVGGAGAVGVILVHEYI